MDFRLMKSKSGKYYPSTSAMVHILDHKMIHILTLFYSVTDVLLSFRSATDNDESSSLLMFTQEVNPTSSMEFIDKYLCRELQPLVSQSLEYDI